MTDSELPPVEPERCAGCWRALKPGSAFCGGCGMRRAAQMVALPETRPGDVKMVITFYVLSLGVMALWMVYARITEETYPTVVGATLSLSAIVMIFAIKYRALIVQAAARPGFGVLGYALIAVAAVPIVLLVGAYVDTLHAWFGIHMPSELAEFEGKHVMLPIVMMVILPPLTEELAFRGIIYSGLRKSLSGTEAMIVSSFAFAILHLSIPSLVTHFPLGLYFCWLRRRSDSLWPGVFAHASHNLGVCILEWT